MRKSILTALALLSVLTVTSCNKKDKDYFKFDVEFKELDSMKNSEISKEDYNNLVDELNNKYVDVKQIKFSDTKYHNHVDGIEFFTEDLNHYDHTEDYYSNEEDVITLYGDNEYVYKYETKEHYKFKYNNKTIKFNDEYINYMYSNGGENGITIYDYDKQADSIDEKYDEFIDYYNLQQYEDNQIINNNWNVYNYYNLYKKGKYNYLVVSGLITHNADNIRKQYIYKINDNNEILKETYFYETYSSEKFDDEAETMIPCETYLSQKEVGTTEYTYGKRDDKLKITNIFKDSCILSDFSMGTSYATTKEREGNIIYTNPNYNDELSSSDFNFDVNMKFYEYVFFDDLNPNKGTFEFCVSPIYYIEDSSMKYYYYSFLLDFTLLYEYSEITDTRVLDAGDGSLEVSFADFVDESRVKTTTDGKKYLYGKDYEGKLIFSFDYEFDLDTYELKIFNQKFNIK